MKKLFALMLLPIFFVPLSAISTEKDIALSNEEKFELSASAATTSLYFDAIPQNPVLSQGSPSYKDANLTIPATTLPAGKSLKVMALIVNDQTIPIFKLADGTYLEASRQLIYDDVVASQETVDLTFWLEPSFKLYSAPYVSGVTEVKSNLSAYSKVHSVEKATTSHGTYYKVEDKGWVEGGALSSIDNRMVKVQQMLQTKYNKSNFSIYVKQLDTGASAGINEDKIMYSASVAKLATLYETQKQLQVGTIKLSDKFKYVEAVNQFKGAYKPEGSGNLSKVADNKEYTVEELLKAVAQHSDNVATNMLGYYVAHQYDSNFQTTINGLSDSDWNMEKRDLTARAAGNLLEAIYQQNGEIISYLSSTQFDDQRISKDISVPVAHKIGDAYDFKHDVAIVYADQPFILSIFTDKSSYDDISNISNDVYAILK